jgi:hypothetical protein
LYLPPIPPHLSLMMLFCERYFVVYVSYLSYFFFGNASKFLNHFVYLGFFRLTAGLFDEKRPPRSLPCMAEARRVGGASIQDLREDRRNDTISPQYFPLGLANNSTNTSTTPFLRTRTAKSPITPEHERHTIAGEEEEEESEPINPIPFAFPTQFPENLVWLQLPLHLTTLRNSNLLHGPLVARTHILDFAHDVQALDHFAEDDVFAVEVRRGSGQDEELAAVGVGTGVLVQRKETLVVIFMFVKKRFDQVRHRGMITEGD